jgi:DNA ligase (NAD+)
VFSPNQLEIIKKADLGHYLKDQGLFEKAVQNKNAGFLSDQCLLGFLQIANALYRAGEPVISDDLYDHVFLAELKKRHPGHPYLHTVEPEPVLTGKTVKLPVQMLSTEKAYDLESIEKWLEKIEKAASEIGLDPEKLVYRMTPKLDGYAAYDDGEHLYTRGDGRKGTDITRVFERGLTVAGNGERGQGAGEIVVSKTYFKEKLAQYFDNARNFQASIIKEKELNEHALAAIKSKAAVFYPFSQLPAWEGSAKQMLAEFDDLVEKVSAMVDYDVDGVVIEVTNESLKQYLGATRHHHRWQIAFKSNIESAEVKVLKVIPQTSRSGRVNPVAELEPTRLSGALISRATAHHYGMVKELGIGPGTIIELTRSGMVIPKIERVIVPSEPQIPDVCPSCGHELIWEGDYLYCPNSAYCPAQIEHTMEHFFKTLGNIDGFGRKTIEKLHAAGIGSVYEIYQLTQERLEGMGFGEKTSSNLMNELIRSRTEPIEDWRFLGAFGIYRMGLGNCERLLQHHHLLDIFTLTVDEIIEIEGFAEKTAAVIVESFRNIKDDFFKIYDLGFNLVTTPLLSEQPENQASPIWGKVIVFTGTMKHGTREEMKKQAKKMGAKVASSVTGKTDYLVAGEKVGEAKIRAAQEKGVMVLTEDQYIEMIANQ